MIDPAAAGDHAVNKQQQQCKVISSALKSFGFFLFFGSQLYFLTQSVVVFPSPRRPHTQLTPTYVHAQRNKSPAEETNKPLCKHRYIKSHIKSNQQAAVLSFCFLLL